MIGHFQLFMALIFASGLAPTQGALCDTTSLDVWQRVVVPDGSVAIKMPCDEKKITIKQDEGETVVLCNNRHVDFVLRKGSFQESKYFMGDFDALLANEHALLNRGKSQNSLETFSVGASRGYAIERTNRDYAIRSRVVELAPRKLVVVIARKEPVMSMTPAQQSEASACVRAFTESLEVLTK